MSCCIKLCTLYVILILVHYVTFCRILKKKMKFFTNRNITDVINVRVSFETKSYIILDKTIKIMKSIYTHLLIIR